MNINMQLVRHSGYVLYLLAMGAVGIQQLCYGNLVNLIGPTWPSPFPGYAIFVYLFSAGLVTLCVLSLAGRRVSRLLFALGCLLLLIDAVSQVPFLYLVLPYKKSHLGVWVHVLKELALAGGAFIAAHCSAEEADPDSKIHPARGPGFIGTFFFSVTMVCFGCAHFLYAGPTTNLVPVWIPGGLFWVYLTGLCLVAAGIAIVTRKMTFWASMLLGSMIFLWFWIVHLPNVIIHFNESQGNELSAALSALAFSGIALMIAGSSRRQGRSYSRRDQAWI